MIRTEELKRKVERLLSGERNARDLDSLFVWLRRRSFGNKAVADVGDFVGHTDHRDTGITHQGVQRFFDQADFQIPFPEGMQRPPRTRAQFVAALRAAFESYPPDEIRRIFGTGQIKARKELEAALSLVTYVDGKGIFARLPLTRRQSKLLEVCGSILTTSKAFDDAELVSQLMSSLASNGLIDRKREAPSPFREFVALYALEKMHGTHILLRDGRIASLEAGITNVEGKLRLFVNASAPMLDLPVLNGAVHLAFGIYTTSLDPEEYCEPDLLSGDIWQKRWDFPLEIGPDGKLRKF